MANRKLKVEVELETDKAKRKLGQIDDGVGKSSPTETSASRGRTKPIADEIADAARAGAQQASGIINDATERAAANARREYAQTGDGVGASPQASPSPTPSTRSTDKLAEATQLNTKQMLSMTRAFSGLALGLAASYSARYFTQGSTAEKILGYGGAAITGASAGAMMGAAAGPVGMAVGGLVGAGLSVGKEYLDRDEKITKAIEEYRRAEDILASNEKFANDIKKISSAFNTEALSVKLARLSDQYGFYLELIDAIKASVEKDLADGNLEGAAKLQQQLSIARSRKDVIVSLAEKMDSSASGPQRASMSATDALMKIGGGFGLPVNSGSSAIIDILKDGVAVTNRLLEDIRANTGKKGGSWL